MSNLSQGTEVRCQGLETVARKVNFGGWRRKTLDELFEGFTLMESEKEREEA